MRVRAFMGAFFGEKKKNKKNKETHPIRAIYRCKAPNVHTGTRNKQPPGRWFRKIP